jgi:serine/threonine protein kinase
LDRNSVGGQEVAESQRRERSAGQAIALSDSRSNVRFLGAPMSNRIIHGKFEILDEVGHGGMGVVYRARQISLDRIVALKMLSASLVDDPEFRERFLQEAKIIARLTHPNIVHVYDIFDVETEGGWFCIVMEFLEGRPLREILREAKRLPIERSIAIAEQVATGLAYAHEKGIIHRDIKPDNLMMLSDDHVKIMDFGIAHLRGSSIRTRTGVSMGTPQFMSPEQAAGKPVDARSDLYSLAVVLYSMVTGELPFTGDSPVAVALKHIQDPPRRPSEINPAIPPTLDSIILKGMAKRPVERYQSAEELRQDLARFASGAVAPAPVSHDETYISTPVVRLPAAVQPGVEGTWDAPAEASVQPLPRRRFSWRWIAATLPGLLALAIVLVVLFGRPGWVPWRHSDNVTPEMIESMPLEKLMTPLRNMKARNPEQFARLVKENELIFLGKVKTAMQQELNTKTGSLLRRQKLRNEIVEIIFPCLTEEQQREWRQAFGPGGAGPDRPFTPPRSQGSSDKGPFSRLESKDKPDPDPEKALGMFQAALADAQQWRAETNPQQRRGYFNIALYAFMESVVLDDEAWEYHWEFGQFLKEGASQQALGPSKYDVVLKQAKAQIERAHAQCADPAKKKEMEKALEEIRTMPTPTPSPTAARERTTPAPDMEP